MVKIYSVAKYEGEYEGKKYTKALMIAAEGKNYPKMVSMNWKDYEKVLQEYGIDTLENRSVNNFLYRVYGKKAVIVGVEG